MSSTLTADPAFFADRGIPEHVWRSRPYLWWTPDNPSAATDYFATLSAPQRAFVSKITNQSPGWVIVRHAPPMDPPLSRVYPELRPIDPVRTEGPTEHWHGDGEPPADLRPWQQMPGDRDTWAKHIERGKAPGDHYGTNTEKVHRHQRFAKYVFANGAKMDGAYLHDHADAWKRTKEADRAEKRVAHEARHHGGASVAGPHSHEIRVKDPLGAPMARRIDVHPLAVGPLLDSPVVFFVIEGCIKADAVLADGGAVFSVPSVSLWEADELAGFADAYLADKTVIIVPDADWHENDAVISHARMCQNSLRRLGVPRTHIAAPPPTFNGKKTKGVDDFIGAGGHLEDLRVIDCEPPEALAGLTHGRTLRRDRAHRDAEVMVALSTYTGPDGRFSAPLRTLARVLGANVMSVSRAIGDLQEWGAVEVSGDLSTRRGWFTRQYDWTERPEIIVAPELRSVELPERLLGELLEIRNQELVA